MNEEFIIEIGGFEYIIATDLDLDAAMFILGNE
jgi:hypothetical protein